MDKHPVYAGASRGFHYERLPIVDWAENKVVLPGTMTATYGPFRAANHPYESEPLREIANDDNESVVLIKANQVGGTTIGVVSLGYFLDQEPAPAMWTTATEALAKDFSKDSLFPILRGITSLDESVLNDRTKASTFEVRFPSMTLLLAWGGSSAKAEQKSICRLYLDEFEKYSDLVPSFEKRVTRYRNSRKIYISKPGQVAGVAWQKYLVTDMREWHWPCHNCGHPLPLKFKDHIFFDKFAHASGAPDWQRILPSIRFVCPFCHHEHFESSALHQHVTHHHESGYMALAPRANDGLVRRQVGFRWNAMLLPLIGGIPSWQKLVMEFIEAETAIQHGNVLLMQLWLRERMAEAWEDRTGMQEFSLATAKYDPAKHWEREVIRFLIADKQEFHLWYLCGAFAIDGSCRLMEAGKVPDETSLREVQLRLGVANPCTAVESGFEAKTVYEACKKYGWQATKGDDADSYLVERVPGRKIVQLWKVADKDPFIGTRWQGQHNMRLFLWSTQGLTSIVMATLKNRGMPLEIPENFLPEFSVHIKSTRRVEKTGKDGRPTWLWVDKRENHLLDCLRALYLCAIIDSEMPKPHIRARLGKIDFGEPAGPHPPTRVP